MASRIKKRRDEPTPPRAQVSKRRRGGDSDSDEELSESELSDLNEELEEETMNTLIAGATKRAIRDDDDEEDDDDDSEEESAEDTPEEREEEYVFEDEKDISDPEVDSPAPKKKLSLKPPPASRASSRRKSTATPSRTSKAGPSNLSNVSRPDDVHMKDSITVSGPRRAAAKKGQVARSSAGGAKPEQTIKLTLKMGKDKLREATSAWTPPPGTAADSIAGGTAESSSAEDSNSLPARSGRGRKIVEEDSESSDSDEDDRDDDDEDADAEGEIVNEDEEDAEGEEDDGLNDEDAEGETDDEELLDSDDDDGTGANSPDFRSRTGTPDMSRLTKRQKSRLDEVYSADLLELPTGIERPSAAKAIPLTADEQALKRAEMARRRKNLTDQRLEEEKIDTINKLLKKQTPKMRKNGRENTTGAATPANEAEPGSVAEAFPIPKMVRWVSNKDGIRVGVPDAWLSGPVGKVFEAQVETERMKVARTRGGEILIQEIEELQGTVPMEIEV